MIINNINLNNVKKFLNSSLENFATIEDNSIISLDRDLLIDKILNIK